MKSIEARLTLGSYEAPTKLNGQHDVSEDRNVQLKEDVTRNEHEDEFREINKDALVHIQAVTLSLVASTGCLTFAGRWEPALRFTKRFND